ncbi:MAG: N-acetylmuramyl-L-alanine amidase, negative regulator of AmpC, AmpD [Bacteroidetes bacterium]|nr:N-acetylmuramyl-L-alanine amidase, negative regulator of AmpC, AmpD [Bacteroidota bacterium]
MRFTTKILIATLFTVMAQMVSAQNSAAIVEKKVNFGYATGSPSRVINAVIVHSTFNNSGGDFYDIDLVVRQFSRYGVSAHYVIGRDGVIYRLVDEKDVAYHAGKSALPDGRTAVNSCSVGIELMTSFDEGPTEAQIKSLTSLVNDIKKRHKIQFVLRHSDIAPGRKTDPWNMNWDDFIKGID